MPGFAPGPDTVKPRNPSSLRRMPVSVTALAQAGVPGFAGPDGVALTTRTVAAEHMIAATPARTASANGCR